MRLEVINICARKSKIFKLGFKKVMLVLGVLLCVWCFALPDQVLRTWSGGMANGTRRIEQMGGEGYL
jgi:hypothetical protein